MMYGEGKTARDAYTRLVLEKILRSDITYYMKSVELQKLNSAFVSVKPGEVSHTFYFELTRQDTGRSYNTIANINVGWNLKKEKMQDEDGNLWSTYSFIMTSTVKESYGLQGEIQAEWFKCLGLLSQLVEDIRSIKIPDEVKIMTHNKEQRLAYEKQCRYERACEYFARYLHTDEGKNLRHNLRIGGSPRKLLPAAFLPLTEISEDKKFNIKIKEIGGSWRSRYKSYCVQIHQNLQVAYLFRTA